MHTWSVLDQRQLIIIQLKSQTMTLVPHTLILSPGATRRKTGEISCTHKVGITGEEQREKWIFSSASTGDGDSYFILPCQKEGEKPLLFREK